MINFSPYEMNQLTGLFRDKLIHFLFKNTTNICKRNVLRPYYGLKSPHIWPLRKKLQLL